MPLVTEENAPQKTVDAPAKPLETADTPAEPVHELMEERLHPRFRISSRAFFREVGRHDRKGGDVKPRTRKKLDKGLDDMEEMLKTNPVEEGIVDYFRAVGEVARIGDHTKSFVKEKTDRLLDSPQVKEGLGDRVEEYRSFRDFVLEDSGGDAAFEFSQAHLSLYRWEGPDELKRKQQILRDNIGYVRENMVEFFGAGVREFAPNVSEDKLKVVSDKLSKTLEPGSMKFTLLPHNVYRDLRGPGLPAATAHGDSVRVYSSSITDDQTMRRVLFHELFHNLTPPRKKGEMPDILRTDISKRSHLSEGVAEFLSCLTSSQAPKGEVSQQPAYPESTTVMYAIVNQDRVSSMDTFLGAVANNNSYNIGLDLHRFSFGLFPKVFPDTDLQFRLTRGVFGDRPLKPDFGSKPYQTLVRALDKKGVSVDECISGSGRYGLHPYGDVAFRHLAEDDHENAILAVDKDVELNPDNKESFQRKAMMYRLCHEEGYRREEDDSKDSLLIESEQSILKAIELDPKDTFSYSELGYIQRTRGNFDDALASYEKAQKLEPSQPALILARGNLLQTLGRNDEARDEINKAIEADPKSPANLDGLSYLCAKVGEFKKAHELIDKAIKLFPPSPYSHRAKAYVYLREGSYEDSINESNIALDFLPNDLKDEVGKAHILNNRAIAYALSGKREKAGEDVEEILRLDPNYFKLIIGEESSPINETKKKDPYVLSSRAIIFALAGRPDDAREYFSRAMQLDPDNKKKYEEQMRMAL